MEDKKVNSEVYIQSKEDRDKIEEVYKEYEIMRQVVGASRKEFNDRTLVEFINDCQKRANGYVPSKREQGKEEWQANFFSQTTRNKTKTLIASIAKNPPPISMTARNEKGETSVVRAEIMKNLVESSYLMGEDSEECNPEMAIFYDAWNCAINGTVIKYDGYLKTKNKVKLIKDYDLITGEVKYEESEEVVEDRPVEVDVPIQNFFVKEAYIRDVQKQPSLIWVDYYTKERFDYEFGHYNNAKFVKNSGQILKGNDTQTFFVDMWGERLESTNLYEVVRYYNKSEDIYRIIVNGVLLLDSPMLWGKRKKKYPFAKQIFEPFANSQFFWGQSLPNILMGEQDVENAFVNSMTDKTYRSLVVPMLIGTVNKDAFDLEDEYVDGDAKIYVDDVNQVRPNPVPQISNSELGMLKIIQSGMDKNSTDAVQGGVGGSGSTAREIVIANERAEELKGLFFGMIKDLWLQKYRLRTMNVLMNYNRAKVRAIVGEEEGKQFEEMFNKYIIPKTKLSGGNMGSLQIEVVKDKTQLTPGFPLDVREEQSRLEGRPVEIIQITSDFLDDYEYYLNIETENLYQKSKALKLALNEEYITGVARMFPDIFMANKDKFFSKYAEGYSDDPEKYLENLNNDQMNQKPGQESAQPETNPAEQQGSETPNGVGQAIKQVLQPARKLPALSGTQ